jgi:hypothetical protein
VEKMPKNLATSVLKKKLPKENNQPIGENSPNLVTLRGSLLDCDSQLQRRRQQQH